MSNDVTEDHWKQRYEKLECRMEEMLAKKDETIAKLEKLLTNAISQIDALTLERNNAKETAAAANARSISAKAGKKKDNKKHKKSKSKHKRIGRKRPTDIDEEVAANAHVCDACGGDHLSKVLDEYERVITEIEQIKAKVTRIIVKRRRCTNCKKTGLRED